MKYVIKNKNSYLINNSDYEDEWIFNLQDALILDDKIDMHLIQEYEEQGHRIVSIKIMEGI